MDCMDGHGFYRFSVNPAIREIRVSRNERSYP